MLSICFALSYLHNNPLSLLVNGPNPGLLPCLVSQLTPLAELHNIDCVLFVIPLSSISFPLLVAMSHKADVSISYASTCVSETNEDVGLYK